MRTNVELDDALVEEAFRLTTAKTKKRVVASGVRGFDSG